MKKGDFKNLIKSIDQARLIRKGKIKPSRVFKMKKSNGLSEREKRIAWEAVIFTNKLNSQMFWFVNPKAEEILFEHCAKAAKKGGKG